MQRPGVTGISRQIDPKGVGDASNAGANMAVLQSFLAMIGTGSFPNVGLFVADDVECSIFGECPIPLRRYARGRDAMVELVTHNFALVSHEQAPEIQSLLAQGDVIVVTGIERGLEVATRTPYDLVFCQEYRFANCKIASFRQIMAYNVCPGRD